MTIDIPSILTPQNIVCEMHRILYIINKKEYQNKKSWGAKPNPKKLRKTIGRSTKLI